MKMMISDISEERWEEMDGEERLSVMEASLYEYVERGIDNARWDLYGDGTLCSIDICSVYMFEDLITIANAQWWRESKLLKKWGWRTPTLSIDGDWCNSLTYSDAEEIVSVCDGLLDYPIIDEGIYAELEDDAFEYEFRERFYEGGELAPEWQDIGEDRLRELAWESGGINCDYFYIDSDRVFTEAEKIRAERHSA